MADRRPHILVLNQYYRPGVEATANLLADLCESLAVDIDDDRRHRPAAGARAGPDRTDAERRRVLRTRSTAFDRSKLRLPGLNYLTYLGWTAS